MEARDELVMDIKEALGAMTGDPVLVAEGIDAAFIDMFARNMSHYDQLPEATRAKIAEQWLEMAFEKSYRSDVARKTNADKSKMMADWIKSVNLLLAMKKHGMT